MTTITKADDSSINSEKLDSSDPQAVLQALEYFGNGSSDLYSFKKLNPDHAKDKDFALKAIAITGGIYQYLDPSIMEDIEVITAALEHEGLNLFYVPAEVRGNKELVLKAFNSPSKLAGFRLDCVSNELKNDKEVVMAALSKKDMGSTLKHASKRLRNNKEVVLLALRNTDRRAHGGPNFVRDTMKFVSKRLRDNEEVVEQAIVSNYTLFEFASERLRSDREFVKRMIPKSPLSLFLSIDEFKKDPELYLLFLENYSSGSWSFSANLLNDKEWMLKAVKVAPNVALAFKQWHERVTLSEEDMYEIIEQALINGKRFAADPAHDFGRGSQIGHFLPHMKGCHEFKDYPKILTLLNQY